MWKARLAPIYWLRTEVGKLSQEDASETHTHACPLWMVYTDV